MTLTRDDLIEIAERYHREDWDGFQPTMAVFDIGRLMGHAHSQAERIEVLEAEISSRVAGQRSDQERIAALITAGDALAHRMYVTKGWYEDLAAWKQAKAGGQT